MFKKRISCLPMRSALPLRIFTIFVIPTWLLLKGYDYVYVERLSRSKQVPCPDLDARITTASIQQLDHVVSCIQISGSRIAAYYLHTKYVLIISNNQLSDTDINDTIRSFQQVADVLDELTQLSQAMPFMPSSSTKPICTLIKQDSTLIQTYNYSLFFGNKTELVHKDTSCYPCDLLPDMFLIRVSSLVDFYATQKARYESIGAGIQIMLALNFKGRSAYCPSIHVMTTNSVVDTTCNNLGSQWDACFPNFAAYSKIDRIVTPLKQEAWLTCIWSHHVLNYSFSCHNMLHQYLVDSTRALKSMRVDHRIVDGTALGALRHNDMIPWTPDVDIAINENHVRFHRGPFKEIPSASGSRLSVTDCNGSIQHPGSILRLFPSCPVVQYGNKIDALSETQFDNIRKMFNGPGVIPNGKSWRDIGYVDLYFSYDLYKPECYTLLKMNILPENVTVRGSTYLVYPFVRDTMRCMYGPKYMQMPGMLNTFESWSYSSL